MDLSQTQVNPDVLTNFLSEVSNKISIFLGKEINHWKEIDVSVGVPLDALLAFFNGGGKRLRPVFCFLGYKLQGVDDISDQIIDAGCALEMLHNFALVHDDFMDRADTRRGIPTVHKYLQKYYEANEYKGDIEHFSNSVAILAGDFAFTYADRFAKNLPDNCLDVYDLLKVELFAGQQMDLDAVYRKQISKDNISLIAKYKSGKYTIERPLQLGALLANENADERLWKNFGSPLGEAFQLRDDVLGVFGDQGLTGKPVGDDIKEGKYTLLIAEALERSDEVGNQIIGLRGKSDISESDIAQIMSVIESSGALGAVEDRIDHLYNKAIKSLELIDLDDASKELATTMAKYVCWRQT